MHYIIGDFSAIGIRGFIYSICNLDMNICTSTTLALKKVLSRPIFTIKQSDSTPVHWFCEKEIHCCIVIFDGYSGASTQDMTHRQWAKGKKGSTVSFTLKMCLTHWSLEQATILGQRLQAAGYEVFYASSGIDLMIVQKAIESADSEDTVLV